MLKKQTKNRIFIKAILFCVIALQFGLLFLNPKPAEASQSSIFAGGATFRDESTTGNCQLGDYDGGGAMPITGFVQFNKPYKLNDYNYLGLDDTLDFYVEM